MITLVRSEGFQKATHCTFRLSDDISFVDDAAATSPGAAFCFIGISALLHFDIIYAKIQNE